MNLKLISLLNSFAAEYHPVIAIDPLPNIALVDLSRNNNFLTEDIVNDIHLFEGFINDCLFKKQAQFLVGGYLEYRAMYGRSNVFDGEDENNEINYFNIQKHMNKHFL